MRASFYELGAIYRAARDGDALETERTALTDLALRAIPDAIRRALPTHSRLVVKGSIGKGTITHTPWAAVLDHAVTTTVEDGFYVVYLQSRDGLRLYLTLNQGCTALRDELGLPATRSTLRGRAELIWSRISGQANRLRPITLDLNTRLWRGSLYELGVIAGAEYDLEDLPSDVDLIADLQEAAALYDLAKREGGHTPDDIIMQEAIDDGVAFKGLHHAKVYRQHRAIERQSSHARVVKGAQGTRCKGCRLEMADVYGADAAGVIEAHHLRPLSSLQDGEAVTFHPRNDFAVLCPNCHRVIHRLEDPSDLGKLRALVSAGLLKGLLT